MNDSLITVQEIQTLDGVERLRLFWNKVSSYWESNIDFFQMLARTRPEITGPYVLVANRNDEPVALWVGRKERSKLPFRLGYFKLGMVAVRQLVFAREAFMGEACPEVISALMNRLLRELASGQWDRAVLSNLPMSSELAKCARTSSGRFQRDLVQATQQRWTMEIPRSLDEFYAKRSRKHRYVLRRAERKLESDFPGHVQFRIYSKSEDIDAFCSDAEAVSLTSYQRGLGVGFLNGSEDRCRLELGAKKQCWRAYVLRLQLKPVAFWSVSSYKKRIGITWTAFDPKFERYAPGMVLFVKLVEDVCKGGFTEMDFGLGEAAYKERFGDKKLEEYSISIYARTFRALCLNFLNSSNLALTRTAKAVLSKLGVLTKLRKAWRSRKTRSAANDAENSPGE